MADLDPTHGIMGPSNRFQMLVWLYENYEKVDNCTFHLSDGSEQQGRVIQVCSDFIIVTTLQPPESESRFAGRIIFQDAIQWIEIALARPQ